MARSISFTAASRIVHGHRRDETCKAAGMLGHQLGHAIVPQFGQLRRVLRIAERFDGRRRQAHHLDVFAELIHDPKTHIEIDDGRNLRHSFFDRGTALGNLQHAVVECLRKDMAEDIDFHSQAPVRPLLTKTTILAVPPGAKKHVAPLE